MRVTPDLICDFAPLEALDMDYTIPNIDYNSKVYLPTLPALPDLPSIPSTQSLNPFSSDVYGYNSERQMEAYNRALDTILKISQLQVRLVEKGPETDTSKRPREKAVKVGKVRVLKRVRGKMAECGENTSK